MRDRAQKNDKRAKTYIFSVTIEEDEFEDGQKAYHASCPALKGCHSWGHTYEEALTNVREAVELYVEDLIEAGERIPVDARKGVVVRSTPAVVVNVSHRPLGVLPQVSSSRRSV
jgi:predicted RNase H-like HicB family nuclease